MDNFRITYQRGSDILNIRFNIYDRDAMEFDADTIYPHGLKIISCELGGCISITYTIIFFTVNRVKALINIIEDKTSPVDILDGYIDLVIKSHPFLSSPCFDFYMLRDGSWKELDQSYIKSIN